jgi:hypothetical protein
VGQVAVNRMLAQAVEDYSAGRPEQAVVVCGDILAEHPDHIHALHLSAVIAFVTDRAAEGARLLARIFTLEPEHAPAAAVAALDLVISVDTSVAHLAGALGRPVWMLLPYALDRRWLRDREDSPWYPTMRLFRQERARFWDGVLAHVSAELARVAAGERELLGPLSYG